MSLIEEKWKEKGRKKIKVAMEQNNNVWGYRPIYEYITKCCRHYMFTWTYRAQNSDLSKRKNNSMNSTYLVIEKEK